jgi:eukaryotic-like serine/threonine-protein kinase
MDGERKTAIIDLTGRQPAGPTHSGASRPAGPIPPSSMMSIAELRANYEAILRAHAIFYPVAYQFVRELGRGRQGTVFLGLRQGARGCITENAIKVMDPEIYRSPEEYWTDMGRIAHQISRLQRLQGPNIVTSYAYDETYGIGYIQMEVVEGLDLQLFTSSQALDFVRTRSGTREWSKFTTNIFNVLNGRMCVQPGVVVHVMRGVLRGLECLHEMGFLHGDVKPGNIMIDRLGYVRAVDLGRAIMLGERPTFLPGTPLYMAPELHRGELAGIPSDLYSVGLVGIEMLRGARLTDAREIDAEDLLQLKLDLPARLPDILPKNVSANADLVAILRKFVDPDPAKRYRTAAEAEVGSNGLLKIDKQLIHAGLDTEYGRDLADYMEKFIDERTGRIEIPASPIPDSIRARPAS